MFVKPTKNLKVRDPITKQLLPKEGADKPADNFWLRRLRDGDVVKSDVSVAVSNEVKS